MVALSIASQLRRTIPRIDANASFKLCRGLPRRPYLCAQLSSTTRQPWVNSTSAPSPPTPEDTSQTLLACTSETEPISPDFAFSSVLNRRRLLRDTVSETFRHTLARALCTYLPPFAGISGRCAHGTFLMYFAGGAKAPSGYLEDGTDNFHWPGEPWNSRVWAGGSIGWNSDEYAMTFMYPGRMRNPANNLACSVAPLLVCDESIEKVEHKGVAGSGSEKVLVKTKRSYGLQMNKGEAARSKYRGAVIEYRDLMFMPTKSAKEASEALARPDRIIKPNITPDASTSLTPRQPLLAVFSGLTHNAHRIHLDRGYAASEGFRNLVVQGPLSLYLMLTYLESLIPETAKIFRFDYRNLAPLFCDEEMTISVRNASAVKIEVNDGTEQEQIWDVWITGSKGGYAVKGTAQVLTNQRLDEHLAKPFTNFSFQRISQVFDSEVSGDEVVSKPRPAEKCAEESAELTQKGGARPLIRRLSGSEHKKDRDAARYEQWKAAVRI